MLDGASPLLYFSYISAYERLKNNVHIYMSNTIFFCRRVRNKRRDMD